MDYYDETSEFAYNHTFKVDQHGYYNGQDAYSKPPFPADLKKLAENFVRGVIQTKHVLAWVC